MEQQRNHSTDVAACSSHGSDSEITYDNEPSEETLHEMMPTHLGHSVKMSRSGAFQVELFG